MSQNRILSVLLAALVLAGPQVFPGDLPLAFPDMAPTVGATLEHDYYDAQRFQPRLMVERALRQLKLSEPSIITS